MDGHEAVLIEDAQGVEVEIAAEQRPVGGAVIGGDDQRGAGHGAAIDIDQGVAQHAQVAVDARLLGERPQLRAMIGGDVRRQGLAHFQVLRRAVRPAGRSNNCRG